MNNLAQRFFTGVIGASAIISLMLWHPVSLAALFGILALLTYHEYLSILKPASAGNSYLIANMINGLIVYLLIVSVALTWIDSVWLTILIPLVAILFIIQLFLKSETPFKYIGYRIIGLVYIILPFALLTDLGAGGNNFQPLLVMGIIFIIWTDNVMAYFFGRWFGKHKLFERISPKKTWEGFAGGFVFALICSAIFSLYVPALTIIQWLMLGALLSITGTLGDLVESLLKRDLNLKDSGSILPGHGGFLDRFDALIMAAPFAYALIAIFNI